MYENDVPSCKECKQGQSFQTHLEEFVPVAAQQSVRLRLVLAVQGIHSKLILLHTRLTSHNTGDREKTSRRLRELCQTLSMIQLLIKPCCLRWNSILACFKQQLNTSLPQC